MSDKIYARNSFALLVLILTTSIQITGLPLHLGQDVWISLLLSFVPVFPLMVIYAKLTALMPEKNLFGMSEIAFGNIITRGIALLFTIYFIQMAALTLNNFSEFIHLTSLFKTPMFLIMILLFAAALYVAKSGFETMGKWSMAMLIVFVIIVILTFASSIKFMDSSNLKPIFSHSYEDIIKGSLKLTSYPFGEAVVLLMFIGCLKKGSVKPFKMYIGGAAFALFFILIIELRAIAVLGPNMMDSALFSTYKANSIIKIGDFVQRIEVIISYIYVVASIVKAGVYIVAGAHALSTLLNLSANKDINNYKAGDKYLASNSDINKHNHMITPVALMSLSAGMLIYGTNLQTVTFFEFFSLYSIPFQIVLPVLILIFAAIKLRKKTYENLSKMYDIK